MSSTYSTAERLETLRNLLSKANSLMDQNQTLEGETFYQGFLTMCARYNITIKEVLASGEVYGSEKYVDPEKAFNGKKEEPKKGYDYRDAPGFDPDSIEKQQGESDDQFRERLVKIIEKQEAEVKARKQAYETGSKYKEPKAPKQEYSDNSRSEVMSYKNWFNRGYSKGRTAKERLAPQGPENLVKAWLNGYDAGVKFTKTH